MTDLTTHQQPTGSGKWLALAAALLGWMFDGLEQGLFPLVARPALTDLLDTHDDGKIGIWIAVATAGFLIGAATGGVLFGWLGDRIGRVRAMTLTVLTYALFSGLCGFAGSAWQIAVLRFLSALGMGGEWSLGVALVMEMWPERSRALLAGLIGAAANVGFLLIALIGLGLTNLLPALHSALAHLGISAARTEWLLGHDGWRLLLFFGAAPALLTLFIQLFVPESERWRQGQKQGGTAHWATRDLIGVGIGALAGLGIVYVWTQNLRTDRLVQIPWQVSVMATLIGLLAAGAGFLFPVIRYLQRSSAGAAAPAVRATVSRMILGACLSGVPLTATWGATQWIPTWADKLAEKDPTAKAYTQICSGLGAIVGTIAGALLGGRLGRRPTYVVLCLASLTATLSLYQGVHAYGAIFLFCVFLAGLTSASFYGWLPLYLPELFRTSVRATGQGFSYNFGRVLTTVGVLQTANLLQFFDGKYPRALSVVSLVYFVGLVLIWFAPETRGKPLPE
jgi:MFS family permease